MTKPLFTCCQHCVEGCRTEAERQRKHCDPCDGCFNLASPACLTCEAFSNFEPVSDDATGLCGGEQPDDAHDLTEALQASHEHLAACYGPDWATKLKGGE